MDNNLIQKYFPDLTAIQIQQFELLPELYAEWNAKINVISRKDIAMVQLHHTLHSLAIARFIQFIPDSNILDIGTGGGFPGIPLAIMFPQTHFHLTDSIGKKITVVKEISAALKLKNVTAQQIRSEELNHQFDFIISRAVAPLSQLVDWSKGKILKKSKHTLDNGIICLKGGDLREELKPFNKRVLEKNISDYFEEEFFQTKKIIYLPLKS